MTDSVQVRPLSGGRSLVDIQSLVDQAFELTSEFGRMGMHSQMHRAAKLELTIRVHCIEKQIHVDCLNGEGRSSSPEDFRERIYELFAITEGDSRKP